MLEIKVIASSSKGNCVWISDGETQGLLDVGIPIRKIQQALNYKLSDVDFLLGTHAHFDHLGYASDLQRLGIDTYMSKETADALKLNSHRTKIVKPLTYFYIGTFTCLAFDLVHDVVNYGFMLESKFGGKLVYIVDTAYCKYRFKDLNVILLGVNFDQEIARSDNSYKYKRLLNSHMSIETGVEFLKANRSDKLEAVYLLHLSDRNSKALEFKKEAQRATGVPVYIGGE